jgi:hypothetical protein
MVMKISGSIKAVNFLTMGDHGLLKKNFAPQS